MSRDPERICGRVDGTVTLIDKGKASRAEVIPQHTGRS